MSFWTDSSEWAAFDSCQTALQAEVDANGPNTETAKKLAKDLQERTDALLLDLGMYR